MMTRSNRYGIRSRNGNKEKLRWQEQKGTLTIFPQCNFWLVFPEIPAKYLLCCRWPSGILFNTPCYRWYWAILPLLSATAVPSIYNRIGEKPISIEFTQMAISYKIALNQWQCLRKIKAIKRRNKYVESWSSAWTGLGIILSLKLNYVWLVWMLRVKFTLEYETRLF